MDKRGIVWKLENLRFALEVSMKPTSEFKVTPKEMDEYNRRIDEMIEMIEKKQ